MFSKKFSLETAYFTGGKIVLNYFTFFLFATGIGAVACGLHLIFLGVIDFYALQYHLAPIVKMFHHVLTSATGSLHHAGFTVKDSVSQYFPADLVNQAFGRDGLSIDISGYDWGYIAAWVIPTALALKLFVDVISVGWTKIALDLNAGKTVSVKYLYQYYFLAPRVFLVNLIVGVATILGCILFLLPGIFIYQRFRFAKFFIIDKNLGVIKALQASWAITEGALWQLVGFSMVSMLLDSIANMIFFIGLFTVPLQNQVEANVYSQLTSAR